MKNMKWLLIVLALLLALHCSSALAEEEPRIIASGKCTTKITWKLDEFGTLTISGSGKMPDYDPAYGGPWTNSHRNDIVSVVIEDGITNVGEAAFFCCLSLTELHLADSVTSIGDYAFRDCWYLADFNMPANMASIGVAAFNNCSSLTEVFLPESVSSIGNYAFDGCSELVSINIPDGITEIGMYTFRKCSNLKSLQLPESVTAIGIYAFDACKSLKSINLPDGITEIGSNAFNHCSSLKSIRLPDGLTSVASSAFYSCSSLTSAEIPESVSSIGGAAFYGCSSLTSIEIPESVSSIGPTAFRNCSSLTNITIPQAVTSLSSSVFSGCSNLVSVNIPDGLTSIGSYAFNECSGLASIEIPDSVTSIGDFAFSGCSFEEIGLPAGISSIAPGLFYNCSKFKGINIPEGVTSIGYSAFKNCTGLVSVNIPDGVTTVDFTVFDGCSSLKSIDFPASVSNIGDSAFQNCGSLESILIRNSDTMTFGMDVCSSFAIIYCYENSDAKVWAVGNGNNTIYLDTLDLTVPWSITLPEEVIIARGASLSVIPAIFPCQSDPEIVWESSNPDVVSVEGGRLTAHSAGDATITAGCGELSASMAVLVYIAAESFDLAESEIWIQKDTTAQISVRNILPEDAGRNFIWRSSDTNVLTVDDSGMIYAQDIGDANVTILLENGFTRECLVHVCQPVKSVELDSTRESAGAGLYIQLTANVTTITQSYVNKLVTFSSSNEAVATVNKDGVVIGRSAGTATITATAESGISAECTVAVWDTNTLLLPENLTEIRAGAFQDLARVQCIILPSGCTSIGSLAFAGNANVMGIHMPDSVTSIADDAFEGCESLHFICQSKNAAAAYAEKYGIEYVIE